MKTLHKRTKEHLTKAGRGPDSSVLPYARHCAASLCTVSLMFLTHRDENYYPYFPAKKPILLAGWHHLYFSDEEADSDKLSHLPEETQLVSGRTKNPASFYQTPTPVPFPLAGTDGEAQAEARGRHQSCCPTTWNTPPVPGSCLYVSLTLREIRCLPLTASSNQGLESQIERKLRGDSDHAYPSPRRARGLWLTISSDPDQLPPQGTPRGSQH